MIEWTKKKGGWTRVVNGTRENRTDEEHGVSKPETPTEGVMTRKEIQAKAKALGIPANQSSEILMGLIAENEFNAYS